jgi:hypothetical protein
MIVGLSGYAQSGKDTIGDYLVRHYGFVKVGFADKLRELALAVDPWVQWGAGFIRYSEVIALIGYERTKRETDARGLLVGLGDGVRNVLGADSWVDAAVNQLRSDTNYVFIDVRFPNEFRAAQFGGGYGEVWRIHRPGVGPALDPTGQPYESEVAIDDFDFDFNFVNDGSVWDLERMVDRVVEDIPMLVPVGE